MRARARNIYIKRTKKNLSARELVIFNQKQSRDIYISRSWRRRDSDNWFLMMRDVYHVAWPGPTDPRTIKSPRYIILRFFVTHF